MLITEYVDVTINSSNKKHYINLGYEVINKQVINVPIIHLTHGSHVIVLAKCDICGNEKELIYSEYLKNVKNYDIFSCGWKCSDGKRKMTNKQRYNVENVSQLESSRDKMKSTMIERYGVEHALQSEEIQNKFRATNIERYGVEYPRQLDDMNEKTKKTNIEKYGKEWYTQTDEYVEKANKTCIEKYDSKWYMQTDEFKKKSHDTNIERYGTDSPQFLDEMKDKIKVTCFERYGKTSYTQTKEFLEKTKKTCLKKYGVENVTQSDDIQLKSLKTRYSNRLIELKCDNIIDIDYSSGTYYFECDCGEDHTFAISYDNYKNRKHYGIKLCTVCNDYSKYSGKEKELLQFITENYDGEIILNSRNIIKPYELDIFLPELNKAFEFNGLYWHNELNKSNNYHKLKSDLCEAKNIQLIHIWEDDWLYKNDIIKSMILNKINKTSNKIFARKCEIREINDNKLIKYFLDTNHIQGHINSSVKIGLYHENELVSLMIFGKKRIFMNSSSMENEYELLRFCNKLNTNVIGGASKLLKYFINNYTPKEITTYADRSYSNGKLYEKIGFKFISKTEPNYYYVIDCLRKHRFGFRKDILIKEGFDANKTEHEIMLDRKIFRIYNAGNLKYLFNI